MKIQVTQEDIDEGVQVNCWKCPVARAIQRATYIRPVSVRLNFVTLGKNALGLPEPARNFISAFDAGQPVEPFEFEI